MAEYIEREEAIKALLYDAPGQVKYSREDAADCVRYMDAADVVPVRHGRWVSLRKGGWTSVYECSECKRKETVGCDRSKADELVKRLYPYCHCGAKMDGDADG